jgi:hypothetical protein
MDIFPVYYFPPVAWFAAAAQSKSFVLEQWVHYRKQQYFNRTCIKTPDKTLILSIPIKKALEQTPLCQREIAYDWRWQHDHWKSLETAYRSAPYFEYYEEGIRAFFEEQPLSLLDYNLRISRHLSELMELDLAWELSSAYQGATAYRQDFRDAFPTKEEALPAAFQPQPYPQVFGTSFSPNLSILDLLFNKGPEAKSILQASWVATPV